MKSNGRETTSKNTLPNSSSSIGSNNLNLAPSSSDCNDDDDDDDWLKEEAKICDSNFAINSAIPTALIAPEDYVHVYHFDPKNRIQYVGPEINSKEDETSIKEEQLALLPPPSKVKTKPNQSSKDKKRKKKHKPKRPKRLQSLKSKPDLFETRKKCPSEEHEVSSEELKNSKPKSSKRSSRKRKVELKTASLSSSAAAEAAIAQKPRSVKTTTIANKKKNSKPVSFRQLLKKKSSAGSANGGGGSKQSQKKITPKRNYSKSPDARSAKSSIKGKSRPSKSRHEFKTDMALLSNKPKTARKKRTKPMICTGSGRSGRRLSKSSPSLLDSNNGFDFSYENEITSSIFEWPKNFDNVVNRLLTKLPQTYTQLCPDDCECRRRFCKN